MFTNFKQFREALRFVPKGWEKPGCSAKIVEFGAALDVNGAIKWLKGFEGIPGLPPDPIHIFGQVLGGASWSAPRNTP